MLRRFAVPVAAFVLTISVAGAEGPTATPDGEAPTKGKLSADARGNDGNVVGSGHAFLPVVANTRWLIFFHPRGSLRDDGTGEMNIGVGWRKLLPNGIALLGANIYYDARWTADDDQYSQVGGGLELFSNLIDARLNLYRPESGQNVVSSTPVSGTSRSTSVKTGTPYEDGRTRVTPRTVYTKTTTLTRYFEIYEAPLEGYDSELGFRIPVFSDLAATRIFAGYQSFDNPFGPDFGGWTGRIEIRVGEGLLFDLQFFEDEVLNHGDFLAGIRVSVPFSVANLLNGQNPFEGAAGFFRTSPQDLHSRMNQLVVRNMSIRIARSREMENTSKRSSTTSVTSYEDDEVEVAAPPPPPPPLPPPPPPPEEEEEEGEGGGVPPDVAG